MKTFTITFARTYEFTEAELLKIVPNFDKLTVEEQDEEAQNSARVLFQSELEDGFLTGTHDEFSANLDILETY